VLDFPGVGAVRASLADAIRSRVAGGQTESEAKARVIWESVGPRWFSPEDPIWRVHADAAMFPGGLRALLLQSLHPLAMAGVAGHSGYRGDPWGRLQRTSEFIATTTFGTIAHAEQQIARVRAIHERVRGTAPDGRRYAASSPDLLRWVHLAETDSFLTTYQRYGVTPLTAEEADRYVEQAGLVAVRLGVTNPPATVGELSAALDEYRPELQGTPEARATARYLLLSPPLPLAARPGYAALAAGSVATLPWWARIPLGLPPLPLTDRLVGRPLGDGATALIRWAMSADDDP
jgi:uncharacterized protein (DUF2236 family)